MNDVTQILDAIERGDSQAADELLPVVYVELRRLAAQKLSYEPPGQTLQATALVHEAYLRVRASRMNRSANAGSSAESGLIIFSATSRSSFVCRALYTAPIPPWPSSSWISSCGK